MAGPTCSSCGAAEPGRFCGVCGAAQEAVAGGYDPVAPQETSPYPPSPDDTLAPAAPDVAGAPPTYPQERTANPRSKAPVAAGVAVALLAAAGVTWWVVDRSRDAPAPRVAAPAPSASAPTTSATPSVASPQPVESGTSPAATFSPAPTAPTTRRPSPTPTRTGASSTPTRPTDADNGQAEADLTAQYETDITSFSRAPHPVVQLAGKHNGTVDRRSLTARGTSVWESVDILEQHQRLRRQFGNVMLVQGRDVNSTNAAAADDWITVYDPGFDTERQAEKWCQDHFGSDSNACYGSVTK